MTDTKKTYTHLEKMRHSAAHVLAMAVLEMFPNAQLGIGPIIKNGFYYDFKLPRPLEHNDLQDIEKRMIAIIKKDLPFEKITKSRDEAISFLKKSNQPYKIELVEDLHDEEISFYKNKDVFTDLCRGPHIASTGQIKAFQLLHLAGAYWRGSEKNDMLQRIYGTAFDSREELEKHLKQIEEIKKRDHKKLGKKLELFLFHKTAPGMPYWLPKGVILYNELLTFWREEHAKRGYLEIMSPILNKKDLYITSGHFEHYWDDMFNLQTPEGEEYSLKAMNCPNAMIIYQSKTRSYRDLPLRLSDTDSLHRNERSGTLNGLLRVRQFRQDDAHCFVTKDQIKQEYQNIFEIVERFYSIFHLSYSFRLGTRPEKFMGDIKTWDYAENELEDILKSSGKKFTIQKGDGAFYGPKVDILMKDSLDRDWQMGTIQLDFHQPHNFGLKYSDADGKEKQPIAIHRVIYGSLERFIAILIEHYGGAFPTWLSPVQVSILPVSDKHIPFAEQISRTFEKQNIRVTIDRDTESVGKKIRNAELQKYPYMLVVGDKEKESGMLTVRSFGKKDQSKISIDEFIELLKKEIASRES